MPGSKPAGIERAHNQTAFQDGVHKVRKRTYTERRLASQTGLKGCVPCGPHSLSLLQVSEVPLGGESLAVQSTSIWAKQCAVYLHQDYEASGSHPEKTGHPSGSLPR